MPKVKEVISSIESINALIEKKLPAPVAFKLARFVSKLQPEVEAYNKTRNDKMKEFGTVVNNDDGTPTDKFSFEGENKDKFIEELTAVEEAEVSVEVPEIKISDLGNIEIEPKHLTALIWLITE